MISKEFFIYADYILLHLICKSINKYIQRWQVKVRAVDTAGAGDAFTGYFLACIAEGKDISPALRIASAAAAISVMSRGAAVSIPRKEEVEDFITRMSL